MVVPKINSAHGSETRNIINRVIDLLNAQGKSIQDLVANGQLTPAQYAELIQTVNGLVSKGEVKPDDLSPELLEIINSSDGTPFEILSIPRDKSVSVEKTDFINKTENLFDPTKITFGKTINPSTGVISDNTAQSISDFIDVRDIGSIYRNSLSAIMRYDENFQFIVGGSNATGSYDVPSNTSYIRLNILNSGIKDFFLVPDSSPKAFIESGVHSAVDRTQYQLKQRNNQEKVNEESFSFDEFFYQSDEVIDLLNNSSVSTNNSIALVNDYINRFKYREKSIKADLFSGTSNIVMNLKSTLNLTGISEFISIFYIPDISAINNITIKIGGIPFERRPENEIVEGWNILRHQTANADISTWKTTNRIEVNVYTSKQTKIYISDVFAIRNEKAKIIFVDDHGYSNFKTVAYPQLKERGIPVTWAINPGRLGDSIGGVEHILSQPEIDDLAYDSMSEFSYHAWNPIEKATINMSPEELLEEHHKCTTYLRKNGIEPRRYWRAAFTQNQAPNHAVLKPYIDGYATHRASGGMELYPFKDKYNINRIALHSMDKAQVDNLFDRLKKTRCVAVLYTHGLDDDAGIHLTNERLNYFLQKVDEANAKGWLEGTTFTKIMNS